MPIFSPNAGKYEPGKTPYLDHFYAMSFYSTVKFSVFRGNHSYIKSGDRYQFFEQDI